MGEINGLRTVNSGRIEEHDGMAVEVLSPYISGHMDNMVIHYFTENGHKIALGYYKISEEAKSSNKYREEINYNKEGFTVYKYKTANALGHYWSKHYHLKLPIKYKSLGERLVEIHRKIFGPN